MKVNGDSGVAVRSNGLGLGKRSKERLEQCHPDIRRVVEMAADRFPLTVLCGHRTEAEQNEAFHKGASKLQWPKSRHNSLPSEAVDLAPYPINWADTGRFKKMAEVVLAVAGELGVSLDWGGNWNKFIDMPHFEIRIKK